MAVEELLLAIRQKNGETAAADISFAFSRLLIRYDGDRFDPVQHARNEMEKVSEEILSRAWMMPVWRWRGGHNEVRLLFRTKQIRPELVMLLSVAAAVAVYLAVTCRKLGVKISVLLPKLLPDYLIGLTTASSSAAFATTLEINEHKLGLDPSFSRTAVPIRSMLSAGLPSLLYIGIVVFLAERYGVTAYTDWWIVLWIVCTLFTMATPPVSGGAISCLSVLLTQMSIPQSALAIGATAIVFLDFFTTSAHILTLHLETLLQANRLGLLNREILLQK